MSGLTRRTFTAAALASTGFMMGAPSSRAQGSQSFKGVTLRIGVFGGGWKNSSIRSWWLL